MHHAVVQPVQKRRQAEERRDELREGVQRRPAEEASVLRVVQREQMALQQAAVQRHKVEGASRVAAAA